MSYNIFSLNEFSPSGDLSMQVAAQDFCVVFIRKKIMKTYTWIDPTNRNQRFVQDMHSHCNNNIIMII